MRRAVFILYGNRRDNLIIGSHNVSWYLFRKLKKKCFLLYNILLKLLFSFTKQVKLIYYI